MLVVPRIVCRNPHPHLPVTATASSSTFPSAEREEGALIKMTSRDLEEMGLAATSPTVAEP